MVSDELAARSSESGGVFTKISERPTQPSILEDGHERDFAIEWSENAEKAKSIRHSKDSESRLGHNLLTDFIDLAIKYPEDVKVRSYSLDEGEDMEVHVREHFDNLFNSNTFAPRFSVPTEDAFSSLLKSAEIVYIDDAILRFVRVWEFEPSIEDLPTIKISELPPEIDQWMSQVQILWDAYSGGIELNKDQKVGLVETLYGSRSEVVETAMESSLFLPIPPRETSSGNPNFLEKFKRGNKIRPENIHRRLYSAILDEF